MRRGGTEHGSADIISMKTTMDLDICTEMNRSLSLFFIISKVVSHKVVASQLSTLKIWSVDLHSADHAILHQRRCRLPPSDDKRRPSSFLGENPKFLPLHNTDDSLREHLGLHVRHLRLRSYEPLRHSLRTSLSPSPPPT